MYSRTRTARPEERYAANIPPIYGGSRFYQRTGDAGATGLSEVCAEDVRAAGADGIPVQYEAPPILPPLTEEPSAEIAAESFEPPRPDTADGCIQCGAEREEADHACREGERKKSGGFLSSVLDDPEELLLLGLLLLLCCENERAPDVIVILLLLLIVR